MITLNINNNSYKIPTDWKDVSLCMYEKLSTDYNNDTTVEMLFTNTFNVLKEDFDCIKEEMLLYILGKLSFTTTDVIIEDNPTFIYEGKHYSIVNDTSKLSVGEWVDFEGKLLAEASITDLLSVIVRDDIAKYDSDNNKVRKELFYNNMNVVSALSFFKKYMSMREAIFSSFEPLFNSNDEEPSGSKNIVNWGWIGFLFGLCNKDITKVEEISQYSLILALNWAMYQNDMTKNLKQ